MKNKGCVFMSPNSKKEITCRHCEKSFQETIWNTINTEISPDIKELFLTGKLFCHPCPHCGAPVFLNYTVLYHDTNINTAIYYIVNEEEIANATKAFELMPFDYPKRIVSTLFDLKEKLLIFSNKLDDRIIEILKIIITFQLRETIPDIDFGQLILTDYNTQLKFAIIGYDEKNAYCTKESLLSITEDIKNLLPDVNNSYIVGSDWAFAFFSEHIDAFKEFNSKQNTFQNAEKITQITSITNSERQSKGSQTERTSSASETLPCEISTVKVSAVAKRKKTAIPRDTETDMVTANNSNEISTGKPANKKKSIFNKFSVSIAVLFILLISSIGINIYQTYKNTQHQNNINALSEELESAQKNWEYYADRFSSVSSEKKEMQRKVINLENTLSFYEEHVVIVPDDNKNTYHIYGCKYCDTSYFWAYNTKAAQDKGYSPCKYCCD